MRCCKVAYKLSKIKINKKKNLNVIYQARDGPNYMSLRLRKITS